jgi:hypothetical protein
VDDNIDNPGDERSCTIITGDPTSTDDTFYDDLTGDDVVNVAVTVVDEDTAEIIVSEASLTISEPDDEITFGIVITTQPTLTGQRILFAVDGDGNPDNGLELRLNLDGTLTELETPVMPGEEILLPEVTPEAEATPDLTESSEGNNSPAPEAMTELILPVSSSDTTVCTVTPDGNTTLTFNTVNLFTVTAVDDTIDNPGNQRTCTIITGDPTSNDPAYDALTGDDVSDVPVIVLDNDGGGVRIQPLNVTFGTGNSGFYTAVLTSQPDTDVTVTAFANSVCEMFPGSRTFTPQNWNQPQEFAVGSTLAGECLITHMVTSAGAYDGISAADVRVTVTDDTAQTATGDETGLTGDDPFAEVTVLPTTGESPFWRDWLIMALVLLGGAGGTLLLISRRTSHNA